jgi:NADPH:quinone reductase-like Zn-dependent oxidoreductase
MEVFLFCGLVVFLLVLLPAIWFVPKAAPPKTLQLPSEPAVVACAKGGYDALTIVPLGPGASRGAAAAFKGVSEDDCVTVRVSASGINYADICIRWGFYTSWNLFGGGRRPGREDVGDVPGFEFAGVVEAVGKSVTDLAVGDAVFGVTLFGGYSSRVLVPRHQLFLRPATISAAAAAALPSVALTAWFAVEQQASPIAKGRWVLVHSAAGGVGSMLVQMCKIKGWRVVAVVGSAHKVEACRALGADAVIDKSTEGLWASARAIAPGGFAAVFDANGVETFGQSYEHLAPCGKLIVYGFHTMLPKHGGWIGPRQWISLVVDYLRTPRFNPLSMVPANKSVLAFNLSFLFDSSDLLLGAMQTILGWIASGELAPPRVTEFSMSEVQAAHAALESGRTIGKLVILPP